MGKVVAGFATSLDGFIAGPHDRPEQPLGEGGERLFEWFFDGDTEFTMHSGADALAAVVPNSQRRTLEGQTHYVHPEVLAPVLIEFFKS